MDPLPEERPLVDTESIQNLDTARMALRWSLERLHKLEKEKAELTEKLASEQRLRTRAAGDVSSLQKSLALRSGQADQRELYYAKLEEFLSLKLQGQLDVAALARRETEVAQLQELVAQKEAQLDKEFQARKARLEQDYQRLASEAERQSKETERQLEQRAAEKRAALEQEHVARLTELHERQAIVGQETKALADRQAHFEEYYREQRARLSAEIKNVRAEIEEQVKLRADIAERLLNERIAGQELAWTREKALLVEQLESWKLKAQDLAPRALDLESALAMSQEAGRRLQAEADRAKFILQEREAALESAKAAFDEVRRTLETEKEHWKKRTQELAAQSFEYQRAAAIGEQAKAEADAALTRQTAVWEEKLRAARAEHERLADEQKAEKKWAAQESQRANESERRAGALQEELARAKAELASEGQRWQERAAFLDKERQALSQELAAAREKEQQALPRLLELERQMGAAAEGRDEAARRCARLEEAAKGATAERATLEQELSALRQRLAESVGRTLELERKLAIAEETVRRVEAAGERQAARFDEQKQAWDKERAELEGRLADWKRRVDDGAQHLVELERKIAAERRESQPPPQL